ncbi:Polyketide cyclase / dehydrase and lipid transport [Parelusimicrobium proximum]|uniref:SRPBCC family protein n=1 Tax=Parelusimicrobium proximum TaxID=3228953 RepID=UPI003D182859
MWECSYKQDGKLDLDKLWAMYSDPARWTEWSPAIESAKLTDGFKKGGSGFIKIKGMDTLPFTITEMEEKKLFALTAKISAFGVTFTIKNTIIPSDNSSYAVTNSIIVDGALASLVGISKGAMLKDAAQKSVERILELCTF